MVRLVGEAFVRAHPLRREARRALHDIASCRTPALGGHLDVCEACGDSRPSYNSCRNRHCPKCQALRQAQWVDARSERLLPTHHFHVVFTLPAQLRPIALRHRERVFDLLFACANETLAELGKDQARLHAQLAVTLVLHTWSRDLGFHPHVHGIVSGGGLDLAAGTWVSAGKKFLFPVHVMGALFRGKMLDALKKAHARHELDFGNQDPNALFATLYKTRWVVYAKRPFGDAEHVVRYLGRYTHRVGISNDRIESVSREQVRFRTKEGKHATLAPEEFLRRFLMHVLPAGFVKIRHFGLLAPGNVHGRLEIARRRLVEAGVAPAPSTSQSHTPRSAIDLLLALIGVDVRACSKCLAHARVRGPLPLPIAPTEPRDTS